MSRSKREIPHYYLSQTVPMQRALDWLTAENAKRPITGRLLMAALLLKAVAIALEEFPDLNGLYRDGAYQPSRAVHAGVAISLRQGGLVAPAIHDVAELGLDELMRALADLVRRARAGSLRASEMSDPTITVTNLGEGGVESVFPIIYPPQVAIVGFGTLAPRPWVTPDGGLRAVPAVVATRANAVRRILEGEALHVQEVRRPEVIVPVGYAGVDAGCVNLDFYDAPAEVCRVELHLAAPGPEASPHLGEDHVADREVDARVGRVEVPGHANGGSRYGSRENR